MHLTENTPRTYYHRSYAIEALASGAYRWNIWRTGENLDLCGGQILTEAREVIAADRWEMT